MSSLPSREEQPDRDERPDEARGLILRQMPAGRACGLEQHTLLIVLHADDADIAAAAAPGLHQITVFRGEPGLDDVVDLAGHTGKTLRQAAPLKLCNAAAIGQAVHNEGCDRI